MTSDAVQLVVVDDRGLRWAVVADRVREIVHGATWSGAPPVDVAARWAARLAGTLLPSSELQSTSHALVVRTAYGEQAVWSPRISFQVTDRSKVLVLPNLRAWGRASSIIAGIVFSDSDDPLIVLNPDGFLDRKGPASADATSVTIARGETG